MSERLFVTRQQYGMLMGYAIDWMIDHWHQDYTRSWMLGGCWVEGRPESIQSLKVLISLVTQR